MTGDLALPSHDSVHGRARHAPVRPRRSWASWSAFHHRATHWSWGVVFYPVAALMVQGAASAMPALPGPVPFTFAGTAIVIALVSLLAAPQWGPVFAACLGLAAGATGPGLPGFGAMAYVLLPFSCALFRDKISTRASRTFILFVALQAILQTGGSYIGQRLQGVPVIPWDDALISVGLTALLTTAGAVCGRWLVEAGGPSLGCDRMTHRSAR